MFERTTRANRRSLLRHAGIAMLGMALWAAQGTAMAKMVIFSAVNGRVMQDGKPVVGAVIERKFKWGWKDETGTDRATTGAQGEFSLPAIERSSLLGSLLPHEVVIDQTMVIQHDGKTYKAWALFKRDYDNNGELDGRPIRITCHLDKPPARRGNVFGICEVDKQDGSP
jgi:hypothetical protein